MIGPLFNLVSWSRMREIVRSARRDVGAIVPPSSRSPTRCRFVLGVGLPSLQPPRVPGRSARFPIDVVRIRIYIGGLNLLAAVDLLPLTRNLPHRERKRASMRKRCSLDRDLRSPRSLSCDGCERPTAGEVRERKSEQEHAGDDHELLSTSRGARRFSTVPPRAFHLLPSLLASLLQPVPEPCPHQAWLPQRRFHSAAW